MNRQKMLLAILLVLLPLAIFYSYLRQPRQKTVETLRFAPGAPAKQVKETAKSPLDDKKLHLELLDKERQRFSGFRRNIFRPIFFEESKGLPLPSMITAAKPVSPALLPPKPVTVAPPPQVAEPTPVQREMARFTFLGFMKKDNRKTIFLAKDKEIFLVKKGDRIAGKYEAANITDEALTITILSDGGEIIIPLVENRPLSAPKR